MGDVFNDVFGKYELRGVGPKWQWLSDVHFGKSKFSQPSNFMPPQPKCSFFKGLAITSISLLPAIKSLPSVQYRRFFPQAHNSKHTSY